MDPIFKKTNEIASIMKCFSNKDKLTILCFLWSEEKYVWEIFKVWKISQSQLSQYLTKMRLEWVLESDKRGKEVYYKIVDNKVLELIHSMKNIFGK